MYSTLEVTDPRVAPLRHALAIWGLTADDIGDLSIHATSTRPAKVSVSGFFNGVLMSLAGEERDSRLEQHPYRHVHLHSLSLFIDPRNIDFHIVCHGPIDDFICYRLSTWDCGNQYKRCI
jgi:hypothetical protein